MSPLFILHITIVGERSHFNNSNATNVWGLISAKIAGKHIILIQTYVFIKNS